MKKSLFLLIAVALMAFTSCGVGGTGFNDGTPLTETTWENVTDFNLPTDTTWENFMHVSLISTITFYDSVSGRITLKLPDLLPSVFTLDFEYTFDGADGIIFYGFDNNHHFDFTRTSSTSLYMTLPAELLKDLNIISDISELEGGGINLSLDKKDYVAPITPSTSISLPGTEWHTSKSATIYDEQVSTSYTLVFASPFGLFTTSVTEQHGQEAPVTDSVNIPFVYTQITNATGVISVPDLPQIPQEYKSFTATYYIDNHTLWLCTGIEEEGFTTEIPLTYVEQ